MFDALQSRWAIFGAIAIGLYVGAEVSIGSIMINFLNQPDCSALPFEEAGGYLANFYWGGALLRAVRRDAAADPVRAASLLAAAASSPRLLCVTVLFAEGPLPASAALAIGFFNSIMFPTIFTLTLERSGVSQSSTSGLLCLAIFGGALLPIAVGEWPTVSASARPLSFRSPLTPSLPCSLFRRPRRSTTRNRNERSPIP